MKTVMASLYNNEKNTKEKVDSAQIQTVRPPLGFYHTGDDAIPIASLL